jgi:hypothetical protein
VENREDDSPRRVGGAPLLRSVDAPTGLPRCDSDQALTGGLSGDDARAHPFLHKESETASDGWSRSAERQVLGAATVERRIVSPYVLDNAGALVDTAPSSLAVSDALAHECHVCRGATASRWVERVASPARTTPNEAIDTRVSDLCMGSLSTALQQHVRATSFTAAASLPGC